VGLLNCGGVRDEGSDGGRGSPRVIGECLLPRRKARVDTAAVVRRTRRATSGPRSCSPDAVCRGIRVRRHHLPDGCRRRADQRHGEKAHAEPGLDAAGTEVGAWQPNRPELASTPTLAASKAFLALGPWPARPSAPGNRHISVASTIYAVGARGPLAANLPVTKRPASSEPMNGARAI
jgi:hypothetical protein